jgi:membrane-associated protease RseP (regulator of RpoE activity)
MAGRSTSWLIRPLAMLIAAALLGGDPAARAGAETGVDPDVEAWVRQLGAKEFARREAAARSLVASGGAAFGAVEGAIRDGDLEVATRGLEVVLRMLDVADDATAAAAAQSLTRLADSDDEAVRRLAAAALEFHRLGRSVTARERLAALGAAFRERPAVEGRGLEVEFGPGWRGVPADLHLVADLQGLAAVSLHGVPVEDDTLVVLGGLRGVQRIDLFGTGVGPAEARLLAERLPDARIDIRRGGRLGVSSTAFGGRCEIRTVEPGSAADQAGLRSGDVVLSIDGADVASFDELTTRLGESAPGDVVRLIVARRGGTADDEPERIECQVRLDAW